MLPIIIQEKGRFKTYVFAIPKIEFQLIFLTKLLSLTELAEREGIDVNLQRIAITTIKGKQMMMQGIQIGLVSIIDRAQHMSVTNAIHKIIP